MGQNREPRNKSTLIASTRAPRIHSEEKVVPSINVVEEMAIHMQKNKAVPLPNTIYKITSELVKDLKL